MGRVNPAAANALGTLGAVFWSIQVIPQIVKSHRSKSTEGLSSWLMLCWASAGLPLGVYNIVQEFNVPLIVQPQMFATLCAISWAQCLHYGHHWTRRQAFGAWLVFCIVDAGLEVALVYACRAGKNHGTEAPTLLFGVIASVLILGGLIPQYYEIYKFKAVIGISLVFLFIDLMGGLVSCLSLVFQKDFDVLAGVTYGGIVVLELSVFALAIVLNPKAKRRALLDRERAGTTMRTAGDSAPTMTTDTA